jgi:hypothetical protein
MERRRVVREDYHLRSLTIDGEPVEFRSATITKETTMLEAGSEWIEGTWGWRGMIDSDTYTPDIADLGESHSFEAESVDGKTLTGDLLISRSGGHGVTRIVGGSEPLTII